MIFLILIGIVTIFLIIILIKSNKENPVVEEEKKVVNRDIECCGMHDVCEAETLLTLSEEIIYYSDEELDRHKEKNVDDYDDQEIEEFREILLELQRFEVSGWLKSLQLRHIAIPEPIVEEALMIIDEFKQDRRKKS